MLDVTQDNERENVTKIKNQLFLKRKREKKEKGSKYTDLNPRTESSDQQVDVVTIGEEEPDLTPPLSSKAIKNLQKN